jgi:hypothetical protein
MDHRAFEQLAAGAALEDLDRPERLAFDAHLATCGRCRGLLTELSTVTADLALTARPRRPPITLRDGVMAAIGALDAPAGPRTAATAWLGVGPGTRVGDTTPAAAEALGIEVAALRRRTGRLRTTMFASLAAAAVLAVVAVGLGARSVSLDEQLTVAKVAAAARTDAMAGAMTVALDPTHRSADLHPEALAPSASAIVVYRPGSPDAYLMADALPATPAGEVYQLWVADPAGVHPLGTFTFDGKGPFVAPFGADLSGASATMVTLEPVGGAHGDPGPQVVFGEL